MAVFSYVATDLSGKVRRGTENAESSQQLAELLRDEDIQIENDELIIDMPEPVSFETGLYVPDENVFFSKSSSAFNSGMVDALIKTLYSIRFFVKPEIENKVKTFSKLYDILNLTKAWLCQ